MQVRRLLALPEAPAVMQQTGDGSMSTSDYSQTVTETGARQSKAAKFGYAGLLGIPIGYTARRFATEQLSLGHLFGIAAVFGVVALWVGRDLRERFVAALTVLPMLGVGWLCQRLLPGVLAYVAMAPVFAAIAGAFVVWWHRRTPPVAESSERPPVASAARRSATERRWAQGADEHRRRQAEQAAQDERKAEMRREQGAARRLAESDMAARRN
jgi:hypothetical protein